MGTTLWQTGGPRAGRYLAAHQYWNYFGASSTQWDWAARSLDVPAPRPLLFSLVREKPSGTVSETTTHYFTPPAMLERPPRRAREGFHSEPVMPKTPPNFPPSTRDLSEFIVEDNSPPPNNTPSRLAPRGWDGRNLSAAKQSNFERGGHRLSPANQSQGSLRWK